MLSSAEIGGLTANRVVKGHLVFLEDILQKIPGKSLPLSNQELYGVSLLKSAVLECILRPLLLKAP